MPAGNPEIPAPGVSSPLRLRFAHFYQPAATLGGDFFDIVRLGDRRVGVLIGDVMGHGARSALVTAIVQALTRHRVASMNQPGVFLAQVNEHLNEVVSRSGQTLFVTALLMVFDAGEGSFEWAVAGHPSPLRGRHGSTEPALPLWSGSQHQPALGLLPGSVYNSHREPLHAGDVFLLFTDGAIEGAGPSGAEFGVGRLAESFGRALAGPLAALPAAIDGDLEKHLGGVPNEDDVCLVAVAAENGRQGDGGAAGKQPEGGNGG
jgi:serine phosphatase RsbU (regulator of sigma subunit)